MSERCQGPGSQTRRDLLLRAAFAGLAAVVGEPGILSGCARAGSNPAAAEVVVPSDGELVHEPLTLGAGERLVDRILVVSNAFRNTGVDAIVRVAGDGVLIRNVRIIGSDSWQPRWNDPGKHMRSRPGTFTRTVGIRIEKVKDVTVEQVAIEGLPQAGIQGFGIEGGLFRELQLHHCYHGMQFLHAAPSRRVHVERVHARDMWGPGPGHWDRTGQTPGHPGGYPSSLRRGGFIGGDGLVLNTLRDSVVADSSAEGELFAGFKMTNPQKLEVRGLRGPGIQIKGTADREWKTHERPARDVWIHDCLFDKGLAQGAGRWGNCIQISQNVASVLIERCTLNAAGTDGHGIQVTVDSHARIVGCTIKGFNGRRGDNPAHAVDVARGSTINADFEQVNTFVDQQRIRLDRNPHPTLPPRS